MSEHSAGRWDRSISWDRHGLAEVFSLSDAIRPAGKGILEKGAWK